MNPNNARTDMRNEIAPQGAANISHTQALTETLLKLVEDSVWANRKWIDFVFSQAELEARPRELLGHLMVGERVWFGRIEGGHAVKEMFPILEKEELVRGFDENRETYARLMARLDDVVHFRRGTGEEYHAKVKDIFHHLITHGYHHRGQLAMYFGRKGVTDYPKTDHIYFLLENKL